MISANGIGPVSPMDTQRFEITCAIVDILRRLEHILERSEMASMKVQIDLHAAYVDQAGAGALRIFNQANGIAHIRRIVRAPLYVDRKRMQRASCPALCQPDGIKNADRRPVNFGRTHQLALAACRRRIRPAACNAPATEREYEDQRDYHLRQYRPIAFHSRNPRHMPPSGVVQYPHRSNLHQATQLLPMLQHQPT